MAPGLLRPRGWPPALCMPCAPAQHLNIANSLLTPICPPCRPEPATLLTPLSEPLPGHLAADRSVAPPGPFPNDSDASVERHKL